MRYLSHLFFLTLFLAPTLGYSANNRSGDMTSPDRIFAFCESFPFPSDQNKCSVATRGRYFDQSAFAYCARQTFDSEKIGCLETIADNEYDREALHLCTSLPFPSSQRSCLEVIANLAFDDNVVPICRAKIFDSDKISCLERGGYVPQEQERNDRYSGGRGPTVEDVILDAVDQILRDILNNGYNPGRGGDVCTVVNSNGKVIGRVQQSQLERAGSDFARRQNSCVVTNVHGVAHTRTLIDASGRILGSGLTEKETVELKKRHRFASCRVMTCQ